MWLVDKQTANRIQKAIDNGIYTNIEKRAEFEASIAGTSIDDGSRILSRAGKIAIVNIDGLLTKERSFIARWLGLANTTYGEIIAAFAEADQDEAIESIEMHIDSPGGEFIGVFDVIASIQAVSKPVISIVNDLAASGGYALAAQGGKIIAKNQATMLGSIGVVRTFFVFDEEVEITSTKAPKKRPNVKTAEGVKIVKEELDSLHQIFVESIAVGRKTTVDKVNANFGQGGIVLAREALKSGMIDSIESDQSSLNINAVVGDGGKLETKNMDLKEFKAAHPKVYDEAVAAGVAQEKDRVNAHLEMAKPSGDFTIAHEAIAEGSGMTQTLQAKYMNAALNRKNSDDRQDDDKAAEAADNITDDQTKAETESEKVLEDVASNLSSKAAKEV